MPAPDHVLRFWRALDARFADVRPAWWGAVVTDARYPAIWDANYARVDVAREDLRAADIEAELLPALASVGTDVMHVVTFDPEASVTLIADLSTRGHRLTFDLVMDLETSPGPADDGVEVEELVPSEDMWDRVADSMAFFGVGDADAVRQLRAIERDVMALAGKRWFGVRGSDGRPASLGALLTLEGVGYLDGIATFPEARGRGFASAIARRLAHEARSDGAAHVFLLADPDAVPVVRLYERIGFRGVARLAATRGPVAG